MLVILSSAFNMSKRKNLSSRKHEKTEVLVTADNCADFIGKLVVLTDLTTKTSNTNPTGRDN